jgi:hypothetical protein
MSTVKKDELWEELDATDEAFVRRKHAIGGYGSAKQRVVGDWIANKDAKQRAHKARADAQIARHAAYWTKAAAFAAWAAAFAAIAALFK